MEVETKMRSVTVNVTRQFYQRMEQSRAEKNMATTSEWVRYALTRFLEMDKEVAP